MPLPEGFKYSFTNLFRRLKDMNLNVCYNGPYFGEVFTGDTIRIFVDQTAKEFNLKGEDDCRRRALENLISFATNKTLNGPLLQELAWRIAAAAPRLHCDLPVHTKFKPCEEHWAPLIIQDIRYAPLSSKSTVQLAVNMRILDGDFAGLEFVQKIAYKYFVGVLAKDIGFPRYKGLNQHEAVQFLFIGCLSCVDAEVPQLLEFSPTDSSRRLNRALRKDRNKPCVRDFEHLCHHCPVGYEGENSCSRATHRATFVTKPCPGCGQEETYFDPSSEEKVCLGCIKRRYKKTIQMVQHGG